MKRNILPLILTNKSSKTNLQKNLSKVNLDFSKINSFGKKFAQLKQDYINIKTMKKSISQNQYQEKLLNNDDENAKKNLYLEEAVYGADYIAKFKKIKLNLYKNRYIKKGRNNLFQNKLDQNNNNEKAPSLMFENDILLEDEKYLLEKNFYYNEIKPKIEKYDEIITSKNVTFDDGRTDLPTVIPASTEKLVSHFPANKDFQIKEISILDYDNYLTSGSKPDINSPILDYIGESAAVHSALLATYRDELYQKEVTVFLTNADNFAFNEGVEPSGEKIQLTSSKGNLESDLYEKDGELVLCGVNSAENVYVRMQTKDFIKEEFTSFLNESFTDSNLSLYPQLRRTLFVLPDQNTAAARGFISFNLKNVGDDYANDRGYAAWSLPIVGHALAKTYFIENSNLFCIGFYDLDYDFNAEQVHAHFTEAKNTVEISESNQSVSVNGVDGWYLLNPEQKEVSFSTKSYIIAIDAESNSTLTKEDLIRAGTDLKIWNAAAVIDAK